MINTTKISLLILSTLTIILFTSNIHTSSIFAANEGQRLGLSIFAPGPSGDPKAKTSGNNPLAIGPNQEDLVTSKGGINSFIVGPGSSADPKAKTSGN